MADVDGEGPSWLTCRFVEEVLRKQDEECGEVETISLKKAVGANENYLSDLYRLTVVMKQPGMSPSTPRNIRMLIVKCHLASESAREIVAKMGAFDREVSMYTETLPRLQRLLAVALPTVPREQRLLGPNVFSGKGAEQIIIMEDLCAEGYRVSDRIERLDLPHALLTVRALGRMHGASLALHARDPAHLEAYGPYVSEQKREPYENVIEGNLKVLAKVAKDWPEFGEDIPRRLRALVDKAFKKMEETFEYKQGDLRVLNHGDLWTTNVMFKYDTETAQVQSARMVDFQMSCWDSPALDLIYLIELAVKPHVRETESGRILRAYHEALTNTLDVLGLGDKAPSLAAIQREMRRRDYFRLIVILCLLPIMIADRDDEETKAMADVEKYLSPECDEDDPNKAKILSNPLFRKQLAKRIPEWIEKGYL